MDYNVTFGLRRELPITTDGSLERAMTIHCISDSNFRAIITDVDSMITASRDKIRKPEFFFGDRIEADDNMACVEDYQAEGQVDNRFLFLPSMRQMYPLSYFQSISCGRNLGWDLVEERSRISVGTLTHPTIRNCDVKGLRPGEFHRVDPSYEKATPANIFVRQFIAARGEFPAQEFRAPGWTYSLDGGWWARMIDFVVRELHVSLISSGLAVPVMATRNGIIQSSYNFFAMLENYNPDTCTFFTPVGELGFALHELYAVSGLPFGELPYEEFVPGADELSFLKTAYPEIYATLWEVMCHFHICVQLTGLRSGGVKHMSWAEYLFQNLHSKDAAVTRLPASSPEVIAARISASNAAKFGSFHNQAGTSISDTALLAGFFMIWLKRCVVPSKPIESILVEVVYPAVLLAYGKPISLLSAMGSCLQYGLRELTSELLDVKEIGLVGGKRLKTPVPRVPMPYTYLVAWYVMHCPVLMTGVGGIEEPFIPFVQRFKSAQWAHTYIVLARQLLSKADNYQVFCCSPNFDERERCQTFMDVGIGGYTSLSEGIFRWLITIRPGYLVFRLGDRCIIEPYLPSRFARQFGYDQLYVGNPNPQLALVGNLYEGARAWYYWVAGNSFAAFSLPPSTPNCYTVLGFCDWYRETSQVPEYDVYTSCLKDIRGVYESKKDSKSTRLKGIDEYLTCEQEMSNKIQHKATETGGRKERLAGKRVLIAEEAACFEKKVRQRIITRSHSHLGPKLMQEAIKSAPATYKSEEEKKPSVVSTPQLPIPPPTVLAEGEQEVITVDETTPVPAAFSLRFYVKQLESLVGFAANFVMCDRGPFEAYRPHITKLLNRIEKVGGAEWLKHCTAGISYVEANLQAFQELKRVDLDVEIAKSLAEIRAERSSQKEVAVTDAQLKKEVTERVYAEHNSKLADLKLRLTVIYFTEPGF